MISTASPRHCPHTELGIGGLNGGGGQPPLPTLLTLDEARAALGGDPAHTEALCRDWADFPTGMRLSAALLAAEAALKLSAGSRAAEYLNGSAAELLDMPALRAQHRKLLGQALLGQGQNEQALVTLQQAVEEAQARNERSTLAGALNLIARIQHMVRGESLEALASLDRARLLLAETGDIAAELRTINNQALVCLELGHNEQALDLLNLAIQKLPGSPDPLAAEMHIQANLGLLFERTQRYEEAFSRFLRANELAVRLGQPEGEANMSLNAAEAARHLGDNAAALPLLERSLELSRGLSMDTLCSRALSTLSVIRTEAGDVAGAEVLLSEARDLAVKMGSVDAELDATLSLGRAALRRGNMRAARGHLHTVVEKAGRIGRPGLLLDAHLLLHESYRHQRPGRALRHLSAVRDLETQQRDEKLHTQARTLTTEAELQSARTEADHERQMRQVHEQARRKAEETIRSQMDALEHGRLYDSLTGLPNRLLLAALLEQQLRERAGLVAVVNLNRFRYVNEALGQSGGDDLLRQVARRLSGVLMSGETAARYGADEFVLLMPDISTPGMVDLRLRELTQVFEEEFKISGEMVVVQASIGAAMYPDHGTTQDDLLNCAFAALSSAKTGAGCTVYDGPPRVQAATLSLDSALARALERHEFSLHYQPQVRSDTGKVVGSEALLRWEHPVLGKRSPAEFIPLLERSGLIEKVGEWVLREACMRAVTWGNTRVAVNLSARQFQRGDLASSVARALYDTGLPGELLELEITESLMMQSPERATAMLRALKSTDVRVMLDDFGTGYSNLSVLHTLPVDGLKIDRSFVQMLSDDAPAQVTGGAMIEAIVKLCRTLNFELVAEGVETGEQWRALLDLGVPLLQGYYFGRPSPDWHPSRQRKFPS